MVQKQKNILPVKDDICRSNIKGLLNPLKTALKLVSPAFLYAVSLLQWLGDTKMNDKTVGIIVLVILLGSLGGIVYWSKKPGVTGAAVSGSSGDYDGYSSYEEMMAAHHGGGAASGSSDSSGCGMESAPSSDKPGPMTSYGITRDGVGYQKLLEYAGSVQLTAAQTQTIVGLDVQIPCCGFTTLQASDNCQCGHHVALYGLAKLLASKGWAKTDIQAEINEWKDVFYPNGQTGAGGC